MTPRPPRGGAGFSRARHVRRGRPIRRTRRRPRTSHFTEVRSDITPSDWEEAEVADGAGTLGFFSASSIWPFVMTMGIMLMGYGIAFMAYWLIVLGAVILIFAGTKLNTQYITPPEKH